MFEKESSGHMRHMQAMIREIANGGEISVKELEEEDQQSSRHTAEDEPGSGVE
jgi:hypothetical protein